MKVYEVLPGLQVVSPLVLPSAENFRPLAWPVPNDFPVMINADGGIVSRYGDSTWVLTPWSQVSLTISFGDGGAKRGATLSAGNADLLRMVDAWWLYGPDAVQTASTLAAKHNSMKPLFVVCTEAGILASDLSRFPKVIDEVAKRLPKSEGLKLISRLNDLRAFRDVLGFELLNENALRQLARLLPIHESVQTAYIPPRIWSYQVLRLRELLVDYLANIDRIEECYRFCLNAYLVNLASDGRLGRQASQYSKPFDSSVRAGHISKGRRYHGRFRLTAERFGIDALLDRWVDFSDRAGIRAFSHYLTLVSEVGLAYLLNFSLMRIDEGMQLRVGCYSVERDSLDDDIHLLQEIHTLTGVTSKTIQDGDARWIVSASCSEAIRAMTSVTRLRMSASIHDPSNKWSKEDFEKPLLQTRPYEPWSRGRNSSKNARKKARAYGELIDGGSKLFDTEQLRITDADLVLAQRMTFGLDPECISVGKVWPLAWHQLRRTGACNMLSTGLVSDASLQYQLKHLNRASSRYYGQNYYKLSARLDDEARGLYLREMYVALANDWLGLQDARYLSPVSEKRKAQVLSEIGEKDHAGLVKDAELGRISYRETFLGGCAKPGTICPLGGFSNISGCLGHGEKGACIWALLDRLKRPVVVTLIGILRDQLKRAPAGSPLQVSLNASLESAERAIHVIDAA